MAISLPSSFFFFFHFEKNTVPILPIWFVMVVLTFEYAPKLWTMIGRQNSNLELNWMLRFWPRVAWGSHGKDAKSMFSYGIVYRSGKSKRKSCRRKLIFIHQVIALPLPEPSLDKEGQEVKREELIYPRTATSNTFSSDTDLQRSQDLN